MKDIEGTREVILGTPSEYHEARVEISSNPYHAEGRTPQKGSKGQPVFSEYESSEEDSDEDIDIPDVSAQPGSDSSGTPKSVLIRPQPPPGFVSSANSDDEAISARPWTSSNALRSNVLVRPPFLPEHISDAGGSEKDIELTDMSARPLFDASGMRNIILGPPRPLPEYVSDADDSDDDIEILDGFTEAAPGTHIVMGIPTHPSSRGGTESVGSGSSNSRSGSLFSSNGYQTDGSSFEESPHDDADSVSDIDEDHVAIR